MKSINTYLRQVIFFLLAGVASPGNIQTSNAQGCNQVEIGFQEPDCYKHKDHSGVPAQGQGCTPVAACEQQPYRYSATGGPWASYLWAITSGPATPPISPGATVANVTINWPMPGTY